jgi:hypothetical protein
MSAGRFIEIPALHQTGMFRAAAVREVTGGRYRDGPVRGPDVRQRSHAVAGGTRGGCGTGVRAHDLTESAPSPQVVRAAGEAPEPGDELDVPVVSPTLLRCRAVLPRYARRVPRGRMRGRC